MYDDLVHCPFCGERNPVRMMRRKGKDGWRDRFYVLCEYDSGGCGAESGWYHTEEEAAFAWNHRAEPQFVVDPVEGVFVSGMEFPANCGECPFAIDECFGALRCMYAKKWGSDESRAEDCPLLKLKLPMARKDVIDNVQ